MNISAVDVVGKSHYSTKLQNIFTSMIIFVNIMPPITKYRFLNSCIAVVWLFNGLLCKVIDLVPRHQQIVARILGADHSRTFTVLIGLSEIAMAIWILSGIWRRLNALAQIIIIAAMNLIEFILAPDLLLWGRANACFAFLFISLILYTEFHLRKKITLQI